MARVCSAQPRKGSCDSARGLGKAARGQQGCVGRVGGKLATSLLAGVGGGVGEGGETRHAGPTECGGWSRGSSTLGVMAHLQNHETAMQITWQQRCVWVGGRKGGISAGKTGAARRRSTGATGRRAGRRTSIRGQCTHVGPEVGLLGLRSKVSLQRQKAGYERNLSGCTRAGTHPSTSALPNPKCVHGTWHMHSSTGPGI